MATYIHQLADWPNFPWDDKPWQRSSPRCGTARVGWWVGWKRLGFRCEARRSSRR